MKVLPDITILNEPFAVFQTEGLSKLSRGRTGRIRNRHYDINILKRNLLFDFIAEVFA